MKLPAYLIQSRNGVYYLRFILPKSLHEQTQRSTREIRVSTHTKDPRDAAQRSRLARVLFEQWVQSPALCSDLDITTRLRGIMATFKAPPPGASKFNTEITLPGGAQVKFTEVKPEEESTVENLLKSLSAVPVANYAHAGSNLSEHANKSVASMVEQYLAQYGATLAANNRSKNTLREEEVRLRPLASYFEGKPVGTLTTEEILSYLNGLRFYPQKRDMLNILPGMSVKEVIETVQAQKGKIKHNGKTVPCLSLETVYQYGRSLVRFIKYCGNLEAVSDRLDRKVEGLLDTLGKSQRKVRKPFSDDDLKAIFECEYFRGHWYNKPHQYWVSLVGLFTGARLSEISQLRTSDITEHDKDKWLISFNDDPIDDDDAAEDGEAKSLKNKNARRSIPMHPKLVNMGLIDYWKKRKKLGDVSLWDLKPAQKDGWGKVPGDFFSNDIREFAGIKDESKVFHSFRYTFITKMREAIIGSAKMKKEENIENYPEGLVLRQIVGHSIASEFTRKMHRGDDVHIGVYTGEMPYEVKERLVLRLDFPGIRFTPYKQPPEGQRKRYRDYLREQEKLKGLHAIEISGEDLGGLL